MKRPILQGMNNRKIYQNTEKIEKSDIDHCDINQPATCGGKSG